MFDNYHTVFLAIVGMYLLASLAVLYLNSLICFVLHPVMCNGDVAVLYNWIRYSMNA